MSISRSNDLEFFKIREYPVKMYLDLIDLIKVTVNEMLFVDWAPSGFERIYK